MVAWNTTEVKGLASAISKRSPKPVMYMSVTLLVLVRRDEKAAEVQGAVVADLDARTPSETRQPYRTDGRHYSIGEITGRMARAALQEESDRGESAQESSSDGSTFYPTAD
jgi:hypothetical protein